MRLRLTLLVVLMTTAAVVLSVSWGTREVRESIIDDAVDEEFEGLQFFVESAFPVDELELELEAAFLYDELRNDPGADPLFQALGIERSDPLPVLLENGGAVTVAIADGEIDFGEVQAGQAVVPVWTIGALVFDFLAVDGLFPPDELTGEFDDVEYVVREINGQPVLAAVPIGDIVDTVDSIESALWVVSAIVIAIAGLATWFLTGRALRPVREITAQASEISAGTLHERVPVPRSRDEVGELATTVNSMLDRIELADQKRRQFVSDASHELRTPVAVLRSEAEVALRTPDTTAVGELASVVLAESDRMGTIVGDLLTLARSDEGLELGGRRPVDLDDVVLAEAARSRRIEIDQRSVSAGRVVARPDELTRLVAHLLDNAVRHADSQVSVGLAQEDGAVVLWVDDDGDGIPATDRGRVFERFSRLEAARTRDRGGAGLGLAVVASTIADLGGTVNVESSPLGGARFVVRLPAASQ